MVRILSTGSSSPTGAARRAPANPVAADGIVVGAHADRHRERKGVDRHTESLVIATQGAAERGHVGVVHRAIGRLGGGSESVEGNVEGDETAIESATAEEWRRVGRRFLGNAPHRSRHGPSAVDLAARIEDDTFGSSDETADPACGVRHPVERRSLQR
jgi:hypothetical protein